MISSPVALPPPNRLVPLHPHTVGDAPQRWFCWNRRWVRALPTIPPTPFRRFYACRQSSADMADCIACGAATPNLLGTASSQHHGRRRQCSVLSESSVGASNWGGSADVTKKRYFYTQQSTGLWRIASPVALPPPIHFVPLHPNTVGEAPQLRFCWNQRWGRVIGGVLPM